jgi:hypothetical protein
MVTKSYQKYGIDLGTLQMTTFEKKLVRIASLGVSLGPHGDVTKASIIAISFHGLAKKLL